MNDDIKATYGFSEEAREPVEELNKHHEEAKQWLEFAEADSAVAHHLNEGFFHPRGLGIICYHCSQAAEKSVKAVLAELGSPGGIPQKHDIGFILNQMKNVIKEQTGTFISESMLDMADDLSDYSVAVRYPNEIYIDEYKTKKAIEEMDYFVNWAKGIIDE